MTEAFHLDPPSLEQLEQVAKAWDSGRTRVTVPAGTTLFRTLRADDPKLAEAYARHCYASEREARFTPILTPDGAIVPTAYAANTRDLSLWETVLRDIAHRGIRRVPGHESRNRYVVGVSTQHDLQLLDIRRPRLYALAAEGTHAPDLSAAWDHYYPITRRWAQRFYELIDEANGLIYESHQCPGDCVLVWHPPAANVFGCVGKPLPVRSEPVRSRVIELALEAGAGIDFDEDIDG